MSQALSGVRKQRKRGISKINCLLSSYFRPVFLLLIARKQDDIDSKKTVLISVALIIAINSILPRSQHRTFLMCFFPRGVLVGPILHTLGVLLMSNKNPLPNLHCEIPLRECLWVIRDQPPSHLFQRRAKP